jgi:hypothetical protein
MKKVSTLLLFCFLVFSCGKKEVKNENKEFKEPEIETPVPRVDEVTVPEMKAEKSPELIFTVQIAALKNENEDLLSIDGVKAYQENYLTKYRLGNFKTYQEARDFRLQMLNEFQDAFVQALKNKQPIAILEAL